MSPRYEIAVALQRGHRTTKIKSLKKTSQTKFVPPS
nr:unnamed protein product [Callosobruchus chinensis]